MVNAIGEINQMIIRANEKKRELEKKLQKAEDRKRQDEKELHKFELRVYEKSKRNDNAFIEMAKIIDEKSQIKNENKEISKIYKGWMEIDKKVCQMQKRIKQAEQYADSEKKQREAISHANYVFKTI